MNTLRGRIPCTSRIVSAAAFLAAWGVAAPAESQDRTEEVHRIESVVMADDATYLIGAEGELFVMGDITSWAGRLKGAKGCPVMYSLCSEVPLRIDLSFRVKSIALSGALALIVADDGAVMLNGFNDHGRAGIDFSGDVRTPERRFDSVRLQLPEPIDRVVASSAFVFLVARSGALYMAEVLGLRSDVPLSELVRKIDMPERVQAIATHNRYAVILDRTGMLWEIAGWPPAPRKLETRGQGAKAADIMLTTSAMYVLHQATGKRFVSCYAPPAQLDESSSPWTSMRCPDGAERMALPATGSLQLVPMDERHIAVRDDTGGITLLPDSREAFSTPWLGSVRAPWRVFAQGHRYVLVDKDGIYLVGDGPFMQSGVVSGKSSFTTMPLKGFRWAN